MKTFTFVLILFSGICCFADDTNIIAMSDWSAPVEFETHPIRGRLLIVSGTDPATHREPNNATMMFVELQNAAGAMNVSDKLYFDVTKLKCELTDSTGKRVPEQQFAYTGFGPEKPSWVVLPYNSTIRLFVYSDKKSPLVIYNYGEPWDQWAIPAKDTNVYYLSASLTISTPADATLLATPHASSNNHEYANWNGTLIFPKMKIMVKK